MKSAQDRFYLLFMVGLSLVPVFSVYAPRALAFLPALIGLIAGLYWIFGLKEKIIFSRPYLYWILALGVLWAASALWSDHAADDVLERTTKAIPLLLLGIFLFSLTRVLDVEKIRPHLWLFPVTICLAALLTATELALEMPVYRMIRGIGIEEEVGTAVMNRSVVTLVLSFFPALYMILAWNGAEKAKIRLAAFTSFGLFSMLTLTESQSGQLALLIGLVFFYGFPYGHKIFHGLLTFLIVALLLSTPWLTQFMFHHIAAEATQNEWLREGYAANRMEIWDFVSRYALESPLYGHGLEATRYVESFKDTMLYHDKTSVLHPHNFAVQLWVEFGLIGALFACAFFVFLIRKISMRGKEQARIALTTLMTVTGTAAISYGLWQGWWLGIFVFLASLCSLTMLLFQNEKEI